MTEHRELSDAEVREWRSIQLRRLPGVLIPQLGLSFLICYIAGAAGPVRTACFVGWLGVVWTWAALFYREDTCGWHPGFRDRWLSTPLTLLSVLACQTTLIATLWVIWR